MLSRLVGYGAHLVRQTLRRDDDLADEVLSNLAGEERARRQAAALAELERAKAEHATVAEATAQVDAEQRARVAESAETVTSAQRKHDAALRDAAEKIASESERERTAASMVASAEARVRRMVSPELGALLAELRVALDRAGYETPRAFEQTERIGRGAAWPARYIDLRADFTARDSKIAELRAALHDAEALVFRALAPDALRAELAATRGRAGLPAEARDGGMLVAG